jgi:COMPASS component SWD2
LLLRISSPPPKLVYTSLAFSNNGKYILLGTSSDVHYVFDSYNLELVRRLEGHVGLERDRDGRKNVEPRRGGSGEEVGWSADSNWVLSGKSF